MAKKILLFSFSVASFTFFGYSLFCVIAYIVGWPPFVGAIIVGAILFISILAFFSVKNSEKQEKIDILLVIALFVSCFINSIILGWTFEGNSYAGSVIRTYSYHYGDFRNPLGYKIIHPTPEVIGCLYLEEGIYVISSNGVYLIKYDCKFEFKEYIDKYYNRWNRYTIATNPFTKQKILYDNSERYYGSFDEIKYIGKSKKSGHIFIAKTKYQEWFLIQDDRYDEQGIRDYDYHNDKLIYTTLYGKEETIDIDN